MSLPVSIEQLNPDQLSLLQNQIIQRQQQLLQAKVEQLAEENERLKAQMEIVAHRIDNFDCVNVDGDPQQRLNRMVRKFAHLTGITFRKAWSEFRGNYNMAYRTNITSLHENYMLRSGAKMTLPQFLMKTGRIEDAIRVADKMINRSA